MEKHLFFVFVLVVATVSLMPVVGLAATILVPTDEAVIQDALNASALGDTVLVAPGTYTNCHGDECLPEVARIPAGVTLKASVAGACTLRVDVAAGGLAVVVVDGAPGSSQTVLDGFAITATAEGYRGFVSVGSQGVVIRYSDFTDLSPGLTVGAGVFASASRLNVEDCRFLRCVATEEGGAVRGIASSLEIERCVFEQCSSGAVSVVFPEIFDVSVRDCQFLNNIGASALLIGRVRTAVVTDCVFVGNESFGFTGGCLVVESQSGEIARNVLWSNSSENFGVMGIRTSGTLYENTLVANRITAGEDQSGVVKDSSPAGALTAERNVFAHSRGAVAYRAVFATPLADCNLFWDNAVGDATDNFVFGENDQFLDPLFCDPEEGDFDLMATSPCLAENSDGCGSIGASNETCPTVSLRQSSWSQIKARFTKERD